MNGDCVGDKEGEYTYISSNGSSVNDYFIVSLDLPQSKIAKLKVEPRIESQHMPVCLLLSASGQGEASHGACPAVRTASVVEKLVWQAEKVDLFCKDVCSGSFLAALETACGQVAHDPGDALRTFTDALLRAAAPMKKRMFHGKRLGAIWFDAECMLSKTSVKKFLRKWRREKSGENRLEYTTERGRHVDLLKEKRSSYELKKSQELTDSTQNQQSFWKAVKGITRQTQQRNDITKDEWLDHFKSVLCTNQEDIENEMFTPADSVGEESVLPDEWDVELNTDISIEEVKVAINNLKNGKAAGPDDVLGEMLKFSIDIVAPFLLTLFNHLFSRGEFPEQWTRAILVPLFKKGNANDPNNYRGISLLSIISKCYTFILNKRLERWAEGKERIVEEQVQEG